MYKKITFEQGKEILDKKPGAMLIDVRTEEEYRTGHAEGSTLFILSDINEDSAKEVIPSYDTPIVLYCRSGMRATKAAILLDSYGYTDVNTMGGLQGWPYGITT